MPYPSLTPAPVPKTYAELRRAVEIAMVKGQQAADLARVRTYHETGRLIHEHVLLFKERADYGAKTIPRLADDLKVHRSVLLRCVQFFRTFPTVAAWRQLTWAHYRALFPVEDARQRRALATEADRNAWPVSRLEQRVRVLALARAPLATLPAPGPDAELLAPKRGVPGFCRVAQAGGGPVADLGFACYLDLPHDTAFEAGALVAVDATGRVSPAPSATKADLFNYRAELLKVVDGDTLWVKIYLRPGQWVKQKLRLRDLDCPEIGTPEGKAAKRFVETLVARSKAVTICTTKPDKYDRYLADVFLEPAEDPVSQPSGPDAQPSSAPVFLNNALLENGHAVVKRAWQFSDWGE